MNLGELILYSLFNAMLSVSLKASVIGVFILVLRSILKDKMSLKFKYALWLVLILRLLLPITPQSKFSIYNFTQFDNQYTHLYSAQNTSLDMPTTSKDNSNMNTTAQNNTYIIEAFSNSYSNSSVKNILNLIPKLWLIGSMGCLLFGGLLYIKFLYSIKKCPKVSDIKILNLFEECKELMDIHKKVMIVQTDTIATLAVTGYMRPKILLPSSMMKDCNITHTKYALLHELAHVKRKDILINNISYFLSIVYWMNPLIWLCFNKMREDRELCCDSLALSYLSDEEVKSYGRAIIKMAEVSSRTAWIPAAGFTSNKYKITRRIKNIKLYDRYSYRLSILSVSAILILSFVSLTNSKAETIGSYLKGNSNAALVKYTDNTNIPFVNDEEALGKWKSIDFVYDIDNFSTKYVNYEGNLFLKSIVLLPGGKMPQMNTEDSKVNEEKTANWMKWSKGYVINNISKTASKYIIKEIDGTKYMFLEWKNGDYTNRGVKPFYYVFKKVF